MVLTADALSLMARFLFMCTYFSHQHAGVDMMDGSGGAFYTSFFLLSRLPQRHPFSTLLRGGSLGEMYFSIVGRIYHACNLSTSFAARQSRGFDVPSCCT
ncbi:hypothetical protein CGRA01v4_09351 [Colletotrichum graminicola]|nr:hypothetical protein CGRA01v4_09351 [Colletotrichum graminicola]